MRVTQGCFSFLPDLTDKQISAQVQYMISRGWAVSIEFTDDPHPRNTYWTMWGMPMFDLKDASGVMMELKACRDANPECYVRLIGFDSTRGWETVRMSFIAQRPKDEPGYHLERTEANGRSIQYRTVPYSTAKPAGRRYGA